MNKLHSLKNCNSLNQEIHLLGVYAKEIPVHRQNDVGIGISYRDI